MSEFSKIEESLELIAKRIPPGDRWELTSDVGVTIEGLVSTLTAYMRQTDFKGGYRLEPLLGSLYAIKQQTVTWTPPPPKVYDIYGED